MNTKDLHDEYEHEASTMVKNGLPLQIRKLASNNFKIHTPKPWSTRIDEENKCGWRFSSKLNKIQCEFLLTFKRRNESFSKFVVGERMCKSEFGYQKLIEWMK